jgi:hypothetical protein
VIYGSDIPYPANQAVDPDFVSEYVNLLEATTIIDEGGNNINIRFTPFPGSPEVEASDYHITGTSPAIEAGAPVTFVPSMPDLEALLALDFDDDPRPIGADADIGADEYLSAAPVEDPGLLSACPANLGTFAAAFGSDSGTAGVYNAGADFDTDLDVDANDLGAFSANFSQTCN